MKAYLIKSALMVLAVSGTVSATPASQNAFKDQQDKAVGIGLGTGVLIGAIVGGPIGAAAAGMLGAVIGDNAVKTEALGDTHLALTDTQRALSNAESALLGAEENLELLSENQRVWTNLQSVIQFKTGSDELEPAYRKQLNKLAEILKREAHLTVQLTGHADNRGDTAYNLTLSEQRAERVKVYLMEQGVSGKQLLTYAAGESNSSDSPPNQESWFFDRKVVLQLGSSDEVLTASD